MKVEIIFNCLLNGKPVFMRREKSGKYRVRVSGIPCGDFERFHDAIKTIEQKTGVNYPF